MAEDRRGRARGVNRTGIDANSHSIADTDVPARQSRRRRRSLIRSMAAGVGVVVSVIGVSTVLAGVAGVWALHSLGPQFGVYLVKPSPQRYADIAPDLMEKRLLRSRTGMGGAARRSRGESRRRHEYGGDTCAPGGRS